jgi:hypothetical protein
MTHFTIREAVRLLLVSFGTLCSAVGIIFAAILLSAPSELGAVKFDSTLHRGEPTNYPYILWHGHVVLHPQPGNWASVPREGDRVIVLDYGKGGTLKSAHALWRLWRWPVAFGAVGGVLLLMGLYILRYRPTPHAIHVAQAL